MRTSKRVLNLDTLLLKIGSLIIGFTIWFFISAHHLTTVWVEVPVCFYGDDDRTVHAPESIHVQLEGKRSMLQALDCKHLGFHIDRRLLNTGKNVISVAKEQLFLPDSINLIHYEPLNLVIEVTHLTG